ncbi:MAG: site-specific DNA-methyltransferase [Acidobacteriota bacterium]|jgi:site-specific DNA-methyltransferase (adenine-specific)|nr:site-specific DNA-methyltransferase [Acidobacteriota bacterium]
MIAKKIKNKAPRNRTITLDKNDAKKYCENLVYPNDKTNLKNTKNKIICGDAFEILKRLPENHFDLLFADPPYNLSKNFGKHSFKQTTIEEYETWLDSWLKSCVKLLKPTASIYICGDWRSASAIQRVGMKHFTLRNRITWEREKGRGSRTNWKNSSEDIWFFTVSDKYFFDVEAVKMKRKVIAPYKENGKPKDWQESKSGNFRLTSPSNLWTDLSVPFWSMPENTEHPTQKPEKLLAKIILASTRENDLILDPFSGSGTTAVTARKLNRNYTCIEADENYCLLTEKRLEMAKIDKKIQGFANGVFWERNSQIKSKNLSE